MNEARFCVSCGAPLPQVPQQVGQPQPVQCRSNINLSRPTTVCTQANLTRHLRLRMHSQLRKRALWCQALRPARVGRATSH